MDDWVFGGPERPCPLQLTRDVYLLRTEVSTVIAVKCCACNNTGKLTCSRCHVVRYCGQDCQRNGFAQAYTSLDTGELKFKLCQEATAAADVLLKDFGGEETFFRTPLVKRGRFRYIEASWGDEPARGTSCRARSWSELT